MARPRRVSDEQILDRMRAALAAHGPAVSLDVVAEELGVSTPALLKRFGTRRALMVAALRLPDEPEWFSRLDAGPDQRPFGEQLDEAMELLWRFFIVVMPQMIAVRASGIDLDEVYRCDGGKPVPLRAVGVLARWFKRAAERGLVTGPVLDQVAYESLGTMVLGAVQARFFHAHIGRTNVSLEAQRPYLRDVARVITHALAPPSGERSTRAGASPARTKSRRS